MAKRKSPNKTNPQKAHPWRMCPAGKHWVVTHPRRVAKGTTQVDGYCRSNPSGKDQIYSEELKSIALKYFEKIKLKPKADNLGFKYRGNRYDELIAGWTKFWNEVLSPDVYVDPNLIKALIATESSFNIEAKIYAGKKGGLCPRTHASNRLGT